LTGNTFRSIIRGIINRVYFIIFSNGINISVSIAAVYGYRRLYASIKKEIPISHVIIVTKIVFTAVGVVGKISIALPCISVTYRGVDLYHPHIIFYNLYLVIKHGYEIRAIWLPGLCTCTI